MTDMHAKIADKIENDVQASLLGRAIDVSKRKGAEEFAQWFLDMADRLDVRVVNKPKKGKK